MAKSINLRQAQTLVGFQREAAYNALDTIATLEIDNTLEKKMTPADMRTHDMYMAMQGVALEMTVRGIRVNEGKRTLLLMSLQKRKQEIEREMAKHPAIKPIWDKAEKNTGACHNPSRKDGKHKWEPNVPDGPERKCLDCGSSRMRIRPFKPSSDDDVKHLLYDLFKLKKQTDKDGKVTVGKEARERLADKYPKHGDVFNLLAEFADVAKQYGFLKFEAPDGRFHSGFNVGVTNTHRWSSNQDQYGRGGNSQNITEKHRHIFEADPGYELGYFDLKQAESNVIANVSGDEQYIEAHKHDTHTYVCRLVWPEGLEGVPWTGDLAQDKAIATSHYPKWDDKPGHDYRFQSKAIQHGSNLGLTPFGMAIQKRIPVAAAADGQARYFSAFPGIRDYQHFIRSKVENVEHIVNPLGVRFLMFGRPWDEHTYKQGLSVIPQSLVGHIISIGLWRIQRKLPQVQLLAQIHDAILCQFPKGRYDLVHKALEMMTVPVPITSINGVKRIIRIDTEAAVGKNWGHAHKDNPDGVREISFKSETEWSIK